MPVIKNRGEVGIITNVGVERLDLVPEGSDELLRFALGQKQVVGRGANLAAIGALPNAMRRAAVGNE